MRELQKRTFVLVVMLVSAAVLCCGANWLTEGGDPQRTGWQKDETTLTTANVKNMKLLWKTKLDSQPREMHNLFPPLILTNVNTSSGPKQIAVVGGISDDLFGIDVATGRVLWKNHFSSTYTPPQGGRGPATLCPGGQTANPVAGPGSTPGSYTIYAVGWDGRLHRVNAADGKDLVTPEKFTVPNGKPYALNLFRNTIYTSTAQGCGGNPDVIYAYDLKTNRVAVFSPGGGGMWARRGVAIAPDGTLYIGTGDAGYDGANGVLGQTIVAVKQDPATDELHLTGFFSPKNNAWLWRHDLDLNVSPVAFDYDGHHLLAGTSKECRVWLLDRDDFGGDDHQTTLFTTPQICNYDIAYAAHGVWGAMGSWQDSSGTSWLLVPFWGPVSPNFHAPIEYGRPEQGGVAAFKVRDTNGKWQLVPAWLSQDMDMAEEVVIANGIVFAYGSGEDTLQGLPDLPWYAPPRKTPDIPGVSTGSARRIAGSTHATLYALDGQTGKVLWSSGTQITSWNHWTGISEANGRVYIPTYDGYLYCFGIARQEGAQ